MRKDGDLHMGIKLRVEWRMEEVRARAVRELFHSPILKSWLLIIQEYSSIFDRGAAMGTSRGRHEDVVVLGDWYIRPPSGDRRQYNLMNDYGCVLTSTKGKPQIARSGRTEQRSSLSCQSQQSHTRTTRRAQDSTLPARYRLPIAH